MSGMSLGLHLRLPPCGNDRAAHGPHRYARWSSDTDGAECPGWSATEAGAVTVVRAVLDASAAHEAAHPWPGRRPELRVEVHPAVRYALLAVLMPTGPGLAEIPGLFGVPIVVAGDLPAGAWRIIVTGPVLAEGTVTL